MSEQAQGTTQQANHLALRELSGSFDEAHGGFGSAPKFPHVCNLTLQLRDNDWHSRHMALISLQRMATGGLLDQLGGGFYRYSVDERWEIPHFEKMLYDNGPLLRRYVEAWQLTGESLYRRAAEKTAEWALREMQPAHGGYCASQDADSGGEEGGYYVWQQEEFRSVLEKEEYTVARRYYSLDRPANFEGRRFHPDTDVSKGPPFGHLERRNGKVQRLPGRLCLSYRRPAGFITGRMASARPALRPAACRNSAGAL
ncbi:MAG: hypothetical protein R6X15_03400 [Pseudomonadota bacterium]